MNNSTDKKEDKKKALQKVQHLTDDSNILASIQVLLNIIPYAGGVLSAILSEYRNRRTAKRILDTLDELRRSMENLPEEKRYILSEDEAIEIVYSTLEEISKTSSTDKVKYLRNSLLKSFTNDEIEYKKKELYISTLKDLTQGELDLLNVIYLSYDPFDQTFSYEPSSDNLGVFSLGNQANTIHLASLGFDTYEEPDSGDTLEDVLNQKLNYLTGGTLYGLINLLDKKGLSEIKTNLNQRTIKKKNYQNINHLGIMPQQTNTASMRLNGAMPNKTPIEASRTSFGEDFIQYINSQY